MQSSLQEETRLAEAQSSGSKIQSEHWAAVASLALCVALLIAAEFMPVSLLTPIARDLHATAGQTGQVISIPGLFAVITSFWIPSLLGKADRKVIVLGFTLLMTSSLGLIAVAQSFIALMVARALLGVVIGGFWSLSTSLVIRLVRPEHVTRALGWVYFGNAIATAFAAPAGSYLGAIFGWRGVFWGMVPIGVATLLWQWRALPPIPASRTTANAGVFDLLRLPHVRRAMAGVTLSFGGAFTVFTYFRPFLESQISAATSSLSLLLLSLGVAGFAGTRLAARFVDHHLTHLLMALTLGLAAVTLVIISGHWPFLPMAALLFLWGTFNSAIPVGWSSWLAQHLSDSAEAGGGLMVGVIQFAIMSGAAVGGLVFDRFGIHATFWVGAVLLALTPLFVYEPFPITNNFDRNPL